MLLGRLRRTGLADQEDCRAWGAWGAWDLADGPQTPAGAPEVLDIVVEPRRRRRARRGARGSAPRRRAAGAVERSCRPDGSCLCCTCGLLILVIFAVLARQLMSSGLEDGTGLRLRGSNDTGWSGNLSENGSTIFQNFTGSGGFAHGDSVSSHQEEDLEGHSADSTLDSPRDAPGPWNGTDDDQNASNDTTDGENPSSADDSEAMDSSEGNLTEIQGSSNVTLTTLMTSNFLAEANTTGPAGRSTTRTSTTRYVAGEVLVNSTVSSTSLSWSFAVSNSENLSTSTETTGWQATTISSTKRTTTTTTTTTAAAAATTTTTTTTTTITTTTTAAITTTSRSTNSSTSTTSTTVSATGTTSAVSNTSTITTATASASTSTTTTTSTTSTTTTTTTTTSITSTASTTSTVSTVSTTTTSNISSTVSSTITTSSTITASTTSITSHTSTTSTTRTGTTSTTSMTTTGTASTTSRVSSTSTATATTHTDTSTTTATARFRHTDFHFQASGPLAAMPNCYLAPLVEKPGCRRIFVEEGPQFGLNDLGQETTARRLCLERARSVLGNSWVFRLQRCEVWNCTSLKALQRSADSGPPDGVLLQDPRGRILTTGKEHEVVAEDHYVASLALVLEPLSPLTTRLRSADGHYVTEAAGGSLEASGNQETGLLFNVTKEDGAWVSLRRPSGRRLRCTGRCQLGDAEGHGPLFRLVPSAKTGGDGRAWVHSQLCHYQEPYGGEGGRQRRSASYVKLWEWNYADVQQECREILGPSGVDAVQLSPVTEHILGHQWWVRYQPVSASLNSRSGSAEQLREAVAECRKAGVEVIVDVVLNHMARPCAAAQGRARGTPCVGWNGTSYGNRRTAGARDWDMATPQHFHHGDKEIWGECGVGPDTGFLCGSPITTDCSCCPCDMYGLPDWNLAVKAVQESHTRHLEELHRMGVTMLRIDAALYMEPALMSSILNRFPWDVVYQEWWHELPQPGRTDVFGLYRDLKFMRRVSDFLAVQDISRTQEVLDVDRGDFYIHPVEAVYPTCFHDGRSDEADPAIPTFKNGLAFHQQQLFLLASPFPVTVVLWGGYAWKGIDDGPPGCEGGQSRCAATSPQSEGCRATPTTSPLELTTTERPWICEHRWQGVAGLLRFRSHCRHAETQRWTPGGPEDLRLGHLAFRLGSRCFVALARGSDWSLADRGLDTGLPSGRYCDLASFDGRTCHREVLLGRQGRVLKGGVAAGHLLAISAAVMQP